MSTSMDEIKDTTSVPQSQATSKKRVRKQASSIIKKVSSVKLPESLFVQISSTSDTRQFPVVQDNDLNGYYYTDFRPAYKLIVNALVGYSIQRTSGRSVCDVMRYLIDVGISTFATIFKQALLGASAIPALSLVMQQEISYNIFNHSFSIPTIFAPIVKACGVPAKTSLDAGVLVWRNIVPEYIYLITAVHQLRQVYDKIKTYVDTCQAQKKQVDTQLVYEPLTEFYGWLSLNHAISQWEVSESMPRVAKVQFTSSKDIFTFTIPELICPGHNAYSMVLQPSVMYKRSPKIVTIMTNKGQYLKPAGFDRIDETTRQLLALMPTITEYRRAEFSLEEKPTALNIPSLNEIPFTWPLDPVPTYDEEDLSSVEDGPEPPTLSQRVFTHMQRHPQVMPLKASQRSVKSAKNISQKTSRKKKISLPATTSVAQKKPAVTTHFMSTTLRRTLSKPKDVSSVTQQQIEPNQPTLQQSQQASSQTSSTA